jgi:glycosyltransferase involved in cell wall biosynthesis
VNKKRILIFDDQLSGHHLEYLHHLYEGASKSKNIEFIFALPMEFQELKDKLVWDESDNIIFHLIQNNDIYLNGGALSNAYKKSKLVKKIALQYSVNEVFFISLMPFFPAITFLIPKNIKISGIIYLIYLYRWKSSSLTLKILDSLKYILFSKRANIKSVFILNDKSAPVFLNKKFNTSKFTYLPDPFIPINKSDIQNIRCKYEIPQNNIVYLHFGGLSLRKGTLKILNAIEILEEDDLRGKTFIFAGKIYPDIKGEFYNKYNKIRNKVQILCFDKFCDYSFLGSLCLSSDFILLPYSNTAQSSGIIGYSAQFNVPVVVSNSGLLAKLVKRYKLGYSTDISSSVKIADFIKSKIVNNYYKNRESSYIVEHNISQFIQPIFRGMN